jgi:chromatin modification-related protein YNG2
MNRLNLEIKRLEEDGQIIPLPSANPPAEPNGTSTPNGTPSTVAQVVTGTPATAPQVAQIARGSAPLPQRTASSTSITLPIASISHLGTPTPSGTGARTGQKRKAATAFRRDSSVDEVAADEDSQVYCFCQQVSFGEMVACDNENCEREWFHLPCVGLQSPPQGTWFCDECIVKMTAQKQRQGEKKKVVK